MARGDVVSYKGHGGGWGGGSSYDYDDEGRGASKNVWEWFESGYTSSGFSTSWLMGMDDGTCYHLLTASTHRFGIEDIANRYHAQLDSRAKRLVEKKSSKQTWLDFHKHLVDGYNRHNEERVKRQRIEQEENNKRWELERKAREVQAVKVALDDVASANKVQELSVGSIRSEFEAALERVEIHGEPEGDWLDDPIQAYQDGYGFGLETRKPSQIKISVTVSLDLSNSMYYNGIHRDAALAFHDIGLALLEIQQEFQADLFVAFFVFSLDLYDKPGRRAYRLKEVRADRVDEMSESDALKHRAHRHFAGMFTPADIARWYGTGEFSGESTWITPLFSEIERYEQEEVDPGAIRLDLVLTDAVLEHPTDIREASVIQERRDGNLQTVLLNFMPEDQWLDSTLPRRCVQYPVGAGNVAGMIRNILAEFVGAQI